MHREILTIGQFSVHTWGVMIALGFAAGILCAIRRARKAGLPIKHVFNLAVVCLVAAFVASRLWYLITHPADFAGNWLDALNPFQRGGFGIAGMAMVGGVFVSILAGFVYTWVKKINSWETADIAAPTFLLGMFFGRFGCFFNGCCFGKACSYFWCMVFPSGSPAGNTFPHIHIHPTQLYESLIDLIFFFILIALEKKHKKFVGWSFWMAFFFYGLGRSIVDYWRWYEPQEIFVKYLGGNLSIHGAITLAIAIFALIMVFFRVGKREIGKSNQ